MKCAPGAVYSSAHDACVWVVLDTDAADCPPEGVCRPSMPPTCGLWSDNATVQGQHQCDRLYSPSLNYALVLHPDANLVLYKHDPVTGQLGEEVWATGDHYGTSARLTLYTDPMWVIDAINEDGEMDYFFSSNRNGIEYDNVLVQDNAPYILVVGDDGVVRMLNSDGQVAWASKDVSTPLVIAPPPSYGPYGPYGPYGHGSYPPLYGYPPAYAPPIISPPPPRSPPPPPPPPPTPAGNPPYASCATGAAFNPRLGRCVWVELSYDIIADCGDNRFCTDATMPSTCSLYATGTATATPNSQFLCDRIFSPSMRYALVLAGDSSLAVYDYGNEAGDSWTLASTILTSIPSGTARDHKLTLDPEGLWYMDSFPQGRPREYSLDHGITNEEYLGFDKGPFRLTLGDDGIVRLLNGDNQVAWISYLPTPPQPPPSPPPSPPTTPSPPVVCAPGSAFNPYLGRCVWVQLSLDRGEGCPTTRSCSDPTMPPSCGLYAPLAAASGTPDSPYLCDRVFSPDMRYALVLGTRSLSLYRYGTGTGSSWTRVYDLNTKVNLFTSQDDVFFILEPSGKWKLHGDLWAFSSEEMGTAYPANAEEAQAPFRLTVGNDGTVQILNRDGQQAWVFYDLYDF